MAQSLADEDDGDAGEEAEQRRPPGDGVPEEGDMLSGDEEVGDEDGQQRGGEQPAPPLGVLGISEEADDPPDHGTTPRARVRK